MKISQVQGTYQDPANKRAKQAHNNITNTTSTTAPHKHISKETSNQPDDNPFYEAGDLKNAGDIYCSESYMHCLQNAPFIHLLLFP